MRIVHQASLKQADTEKSRSSSEGDMEYENAETALDSSGSHEENQNGEDATDVPEGGDGEAPENDDASANDEEEEDDVNDEDASETVESEASPKEKTKKAGKGKKAAGKEKKKRGRKPNAANGVKKTPKRSTKENKAQNDQDDEEEEEYEVEDIVDHKTVRGKTQYRIRWKGWGEDDDTWEAEDTLSCPDIVARYKKKVEKEDGGKKPGKRGPKRKGIPIKIQPKAKERKVDEENPDKEWEVDRIIDIRYKKNKSREFLIRWKGWGPSYDSWEPEKFVNCPDLVKKLLDKVDNAKSKTPKQLREMPKKAERYSTNVKSKGVRTSRRHNNKQRKTYYDAD